jgi:hypothetical protein
MVPNLHGVTVRNLAVDALGDDELAALGAVADKVLARLDEAAQPPDATSNG